MSLENLLIVAARAMLGLFLAALLAFLLYMVTLSTVLLVTALEAIDYRLFTWLAVSVGAGIGGYLGWFRRHLGVWRNTATLGSAIAAAAAGALVGRVQFDATFVGAILAVNLVLMAVHVLATLRQQDE